MARPLRLDDALVSLAEIEGKLQKRTVPKQIEYWAELGRCLERNVDRAGLVAIVQDLANVDVKPKRSWPIDPDEVFQAVDNDRASGHLADAVTLAKVAYEASVSHPGMLDQIRENGQRVTGSFLNGEFVPGATSKVG